MNKHPYNVYFTKDELSCPCCGAMEVTPFTLALLADLRERLNFVLPVHTGYLCLEAETSTMLSEAQEKAQEAHHKGVAITLSLEGKRLYKALREALSMGYTRVGLGKGKLYIEMDMNTPYSEVFVLEDK